MSECLKHIGPKLISCLSFLQYMLRLNIITFPTSPISGVTLPLPSLRERTIPPSEPAVFTVLVKSSSSTALLATIPALFI